MYFLHYRYVYIYEGINRLHVLLSPLPVTMMMRMMMTRVYINTVYVHLEAMKKSSHLM